jgi:hypothetical protein
MYLDSKIDGSSHSGQNHLGSGWRPFSKYQKAVDLSEGNTLDETL